MANKGKKKLSERELHLQYLENVRGMAQAFAQSHAEGAIDCLCENEELEAAAALVFLLEALTGETEGRSECQNCGMVWPDAFLLPIEDLYQRVQPGEPMPSGECPDRDCGALCQPVGA